MGAFIFFIAGGLIWVVVAIYQFINMVYAVCGYFLALQLVSTAEMLVKEVVILSSTDEIYALPALGLFFCFGAALLLYGLNKMTIVAAAVLSFFLSLVWFMFGWEPVSFFIGLLFFVLMPFFLRKLTFPIILWLDENDGWLNCLWDTFLLALISAPAVIVVFTEILYFIDGDRKAAEGFASYFLLPVLYTLILFANLKRNKVFLS